MTEFEGIVPKVRSARDVWWVDLLLTQLEEKLDIDKRTGLEVLIEEPAALLNVRGGSCCKDLLTAIGILLKLHFI